MSSKAQIQGNEIFVFLLALIIVTATLLLGYKGIKMISEQGEQAELQTFKNAVIQDVNKYQAYESRSGTITYTLPTKINFVCFLELNAFNQKHEICDIFSNNYQPLACDAWRQSTVSVFLSPPTNFDLKLSSLAVENGAFCLNNTLGKIKVEYQGEGDRTKIKRA